MPISTFPCDPDSDIPLLKRYPWQAIVRFCRENPLTADIYLREGTKLYDDAAVLRPQSLERLFTDVFWDITIRNVGLTTFHHDFLEMYRIDSTGRLMERP